MIENVPSWEIFPFNYPDSFQVTLNSLDTTSILNCRMVCTTWRNWFNTSKTVWSSVLSKVVIRAISRRVKVELEQVWEIRLDLLLEMMDECWTEKQEMSMAIRIERAAKQKLWKEFEVRNYFAISDLISIVFSTPWRWLISYIKNLPEDQ